jgi:hypothetical protein
VRKRRGVRRPRVPAYNLLLPQTRYQAEMLEPFSLEKAPIVPSNAAFPSCFRALLAFGESA